MTWKIAFQQFEKFAECYRKEYGKSPVLVIDNINQLAKKDPAILEILQDGAKAAVGSGLFKAVFVTSDGSAPSQMGGYFCL